MINSLKIKKLAAALAVCVAAGTAAGAVIHEDAEAQARLAAMESVAETASVQETPEKPVPTAKNVDDIKGTVNILLIGTDEKRTDYDDQGRGDVTLLCSVNAENKTVKLISFERSTGLQRKASASASA